MMPDALGNHLGSQCCLYRDDLVQAPRMQFLSSSKIHVCGCRALHSRQHVQIPSLPSALSLEPSASHWSSTPPDLLHHFPIPGNQMHEICMQFFHSRKQLLLRQTLASDSAVI